MNYGLDVALVDSHTEGDGAAQDLDLTRDEVLLDVGAPVVHHARVIGTSFEAVLVQDGGQLFCCPSLRCKNQDRIQLLEHG